MQLPPFLFISFAIRSFSARFRIPPYSPKLDDEQGYRGCRREGGQNLIEHRTSLLSERRPRRTLLAAANCSKCESGSETRAPRKPSQPAERLIGLLFDRINPLDAHRVKSGTDFDADLADAGGLQNPPVPFCKAPCGRFRRDGSQPSVAAKPMGNIASCPHA